MEVAIKTDLRQFTKGMKDLAKRQVPFAIAQALTATARIAAEEWSDEMRTVLDRPTPFTQKSVSVRGARKTRLVATVFLRDIAAEYLQPYVEGGPHFLGKKKGLLTPKNVGLNAYGNLPKSKLASLKAKPNVFVGPVQLKSGQVVSGVWQRSSPGLRRRSAQVAAESKARAGSLKLLIRFSDPQPVKQRLDFRGRTERAVRQHFETEYNKAFAAALASAK